MSYYGPASEPNPKPRNRTALPPPYDYSKHGNPDDRPAIAMHRAGHFNRHNKRLRKHTRVVPWRDEWELQSVGKALLSVLDEDGGDGGVDDRPGDEVCPLPLPPTQISPEEALATIAVWKSRLASADGLPQAIESTAALAAVYRRDSQRRIQRRSRSRLRSTFRSTLRSTSTLMPMPMAISMSMSIPGVTELRLAYSAAIVRCINGFADSLQQQRAMAASVSNLCGQLGIPSWLVDTRHESSHNALPNLEVLRLSASTLLEFLRELFWIPRCVEWNQGGNGKGNGNGNGGDGGEQPPGAEAAPGAGHQAGVQGPIPDPSPIDYLVRYKACASTWATTRSTTTIENNNETKTKGGRATGKRKKKTPPKTTILPYDPLFGEVGTFSSSDEDNDDDDDDDTENSTEDNVDLGKPAVNSFWGSSVGTNINRYFLLEPPKKKKKKGKEKKKKTPKKAIQNNPKKKKGEKSPNDCARFFVRSVPSLQEGYAIAIRYLVWGGVGGAPDGRGVLIPGSEIAFPASPQGVSKCWQRYSPLVHVVSRTWPGFAAHMTTHLVDCVLSIEDGGIVHDNSTETGTDNQNDNDNDNDNDYHNDNGNRQPEERQGLDPGSIRKLYFLHAWIRLMLSQRFMAALDPNFSVTTTNAKNANPLDLPLAKLEHLESLGYPLNSLLDRLRRSDNPHRVDSNDANDSQSMGTSREIIRNLETILGPKRSRGFGYLGHEAAATRDASSAIEPSSVSHPSESQDASTATSGADVGEHRAGQMSLDDMEAILLSEDKSDSGERGGEMETEAASASASAAAHHGDKVEKETSMPIESSAKASTSMQPAEKEHELRTLPKQRRPAWIRCERWDACAIGTFPGYPC